MTEPKLNKRDQARAATRNRILTTARTLFLIDGYRDTTIRGIAAGAQMSTGAIFANWPDKAALWVECFAAPPPSDRLADIVSIILGVLPGWRIMIQPAHGGFHASLTAPDQLTEYDASGPSPATALECALATHRQSTAASAA